jgi:hypothetical protein
MDKTWKNVKMFISVECARKNKQNKLTTKRFKANLMEEQAEATEELIATLTENHTCQMEALIKSTMDAMKEMMQLIKNEAKTPSNPTKLLDKEKKKKRDEKRKWYNEAPICTHCGKRHPSKKEVECWDLEKNKVLHPNTWKLFKSAWRCGGSTIETETWQPGKVKSNTLNTNIIYPAVSNYWTPLNHNDKEETTKEEETHMHMLWSTKTNLDQNQISGNGE